MDQFDRFEDAKQLVNNESFLELITVERSIVLHPMFAGDLLEGIRDCLDSEKNLYSNRYGGVILSYGNIKHCGQLAHIHHGTGSSLHRIKVDLVIFRPQVGSRLKAVVNKVGKDYIGCLVLNRFNASVPKSEIPADGVELGQEVSLEIKEVVSQRKILYMKGSLADVSFKTKEKKKKKKEKETEEPPQDETDTPKSPNEDTPAGKKSKKRKRQPSLEGEAEELTPKRQRSEGKSRHRSSRSPDSGGSGVLSVDSDEAATPVVDSTPRAPSSSSSKHKKQKKKEKL